MKSDNANKSDGLAAPETNRGGAEALLTSNIADSLDLLVEYLVDNEIEGIHPLIMGEVEKRLIIRVLERSRGNKLQAAKILGMSRNTFHRKVQKLSETSELGFVTPDS